MRWGVEKRLEFIEFRLYWEGGINRADITEQFGVSVPQASKDLTLYEEKAPGNLVYDKSAKRYLASPDFKPVFLEPRAGMYLAQLRASVVSADGLQESWLAAAPEFDTTPVPYRRVEVEVLRAILAAIRNKRAIKVEYQSMNVQRPTPEWRWITPHALAFDGLRWHVRASCHIDQKFKDFILSRCLQVRGEGEPAAMSEADRYWSETFEVTLKPNPALSKAQQAVIAQDYEMTDGKVTVPVRKALLYYFQKRMRLDAADSLDQPHETPVIVSNRAAFDAALAEAMS
ncbi:WYL domain-containing protein [Roseospirillum parvum]|uniref:Predicted DNA-binding transcriptional regulator YafY, contains an HTH and WYL domains n=1 Tax=Roseospirillum parvum TaxID=83401 RepID=A0A1G8F3D8_9PROT|nr:WYL domain-containing protein [Roseospirillum parvum]SDH76608.1 Predicted DNA-binding transcriptional regulator YafY, contains an HTH and WYL domains [Roseospirillum parvum]